MTDPTPRYQQLKDFVVARVTAGEWAAGSRVPSEHELTQSFRISRMTVNRALRELTAEGWLKRVQGAGTFVAEAKPQSALMEIRNIRDEIAGRGHRHRAKVLLLAGATADAAVARALEMRLGQRVYHSRLLHLENDLPIQVEERFINPKFAPDYLKQDFTQITPYQYLTAMGAIERAEHVIEAIAPDAELRRLLKLKAGAPALLLTRRTWSKGLVGTFARLIYPGGYQLVGQQDLKTNR